jgi:hypothetical protein
MCNFIKKIIRSEYLKNEIESIFGNLFIYIININTVMRIIIELSEYFELSNNRIVFKTFFFLFSNKRIINFKRLFLVKLRYEKLTNNLGEW